MKEDVKEILNEDNLNQVPGGKMVINDETKESTEGSSEE